MVMLTCISSQNSSCVQIELDYDAAPASRLLILDLPMLVWMLLLVFASPSGQHLSVISTPAELQADDTRESPDDVQGFLATGVSRDIPWFPAIKFRGRFLTCSAPCLSPST
jgi:hypothetical protein